MEVNHDKLRELHGILVQACIDFINKNNLTDVDEVSFNADSLQESSKDGKWMPCTDSYLGAYRYNGNIRELIGESL